MNYDILSDPRIEDLIDYYRGTGLLIVGLNDSQGVNINSTFFKQGILEYLAAILTFGGLTPEVINAFSLTMNKTEHIDYFLKSNLSLEEIKLSQIYSAVSAFEKVMSDMGLPKSLGKIANVYKLIYRPQPGDDKIRITTSLKQAQEPILIYSSGVNDLMREVGANPTSIKRDYIMRNKKPNYFYTLDRACDPRTLKKVMNSIKQNYENILAINPMSDIYTLGAYIPKSLRSKEMDIFRYLITAYNEELANLCKEYNTTFIATEDIGRHYNNSEVNFHVSSKGHNVLAYNILLSIYQNKIESKNIVVDDNKYNIDNSGSKGVARATLKDGLHSYVNAMELSGYKRERQLAIFKEHKRETEIFEKVLTNKKYK